MLKGKVVDLKEDGTAVIEAPVDIGQFIHRKVKEVYIDPIDSRPLSDRQRRMCYALIKASADWAGSDAEEVKEINAKLAAIAGKLPHETLKKYQQKRKERIFPIIVPLSGDRCVCGMDFPLAQQGKLAGGNVVECENCHRFVYKE